MSCLSFKLAELLYKHYNITAYIRPIPEHRPSKLKAYKTLTFHEIKTGPHIRECKYHEQLLLTHINSDPQLCYRSILIGQY